MYIDFGEAIDMFGVDGRTIHHWIKNGAPVYEVADDEGELGPVFEPRELREWLITEEWLDELDERGVFDD